MCARVNVRMSQIMRTQIKVGVRTYATYANCRTLGPQSQYLGDAYRYPANIYLFKINNRNSRKRCEICSKLTIKTPE